jgi:hypothetical protein
MTFSIVRRIGRTRSSAGKVRLMDTLDYLDRGRATLFIQSRRKLGMVVARRSLDPRLVPEAKRN